MKKAYRLINDDINTVCDIISQNLEKSRLVSSEVLRIKLVFEEALLNMKDFFGEGEPFALIVTHKKLISCVEIQIKGQSFNPLDILGDEDDEYELMQALSSYGEVFPTWFYQNGTNRIAFTFKKKSQHSSFFYILIAVISALLLGALTNILPNSAQSYILENIINPFYNTSIGIVVAISGPLVFLTILWGILGVGSLFEFMSIGRKLLRSFVLISLVVSVVSIVLQLPWMTTTLGELSTFKLKDTLELLLNIIPNNIITPFSEGNSLQIVLLGVVFGVVIIALSRKISLMHNLVSECNLIVSEIMNGVNKIIPFLVFFSLFKVMTSENKAILNNSWQVLLNIVISMLLLMIIFTVITSIRTKISINLLLKKLLPSVLVAFSASSSAASFGVTMETLKHKLGIEERVVNIGLPIGQVVFKAGACLFFTVSSMYLAEYYDITVNLQFIITAIFICTVLSMSLPPITGSACIVGTIILSSLHIPSEAIALFLALSTIADALATATNALALDCVLINSAHKLGAIDKEKFLSSK